MFTLIEIDPQDPPIVYKRLADQAFKGMPIFKHSIARKPGQWRLSERKSRRLVIKEVNPLACEFFLRSYQPFVVLLVRHPAAVALSFQKLGWINLQDAVMEGGRAKASIWERHGTRQGYVLRKAWDCLEAYPLRVVVTYEELCSNPVGLFQELYGATNLTWDRAIEQLVIDLTSGGDLSDHFDFHRDSAALIDAWRENLGKTELAELKSGYMRFSLPWYNLPEHW